MQKAYSEHRSYRLTWSKCADKAATAGPVNWYDHREVIILRRENKLWEVWHNNAAAKRAAKVIFLAGLVKCTIIKRYPGSSSC